MRAATRANLPLPAAEFVDAVKFFYTHHMRCRLVAELALCAAACEVIATLRGWSRRRCTSLCGKDRCAARQGRAQAMRQIWITKFGQPEVLAVRQAPDPEPRPNEVRIRVEAS